MRYFLLVGSKLTLCLPKQNIIETSSLIVSAYQIEKGLRGARANVFATGLLRPLLNFELFIMKGYYNPSRRLYKNG
jgi:hypothetical protein